MWLAKTLQFLNTLALMGLISIPGFGQHGSTHGTVTDATGAAIPAATVTATNARQGDKHSATTNEQGLYVLQQLQPGPYEVVISSARIPGDKGDAGTQRRPDPQPRCGARCSSQATVVQVVESTGATVDTSSARIGSNVTAREVQELPVNGRTYSLLALSAPGATNTGDGAFDKVRFNGKATEQNQFRYDGVDASAVFDTAPGWLLVSGSQFRLQNSVESIQEFRVDSARIRPNMERGQVDRSTSFQSPAATSSTARSLNISGTTKWMLAISLMGQRSRNSG